MRSGNNLDSLLRRLVKMGLRPGCTAIVIHRGKIIFEGGYGYADIARRRPIKPDTIFRLYSMTKPVTVVAALILLERGLYNLHDPVADFLPDFANCQVLETQADGSAGLRKARTTLRIRDLFCMTSGIAYDDSQTPNGPLLRSALRELLNGRNDVETVDVQALARTIARVPLAFDPGEHWLYGMSHDVLGALIEVISGKRLSDFMQHEIFDPLKMNNTGFRLREGWTERLAGLYTCRDQAFAPIKDRLFTDPQDTVEYGGAGLLGTLEDYARFALMLQQGGTLDAKKILGRQTVAMMTRNHLNAQQLQDFNWTHLAGYGYGLGVRTLLDPTAAGSTSQVGEFGWGGMAGTWFFVDPQAELVGVYGQQLVPSGEEFHAPLFLNVASSLI